MKRLLYLTTDSKMAGTETVIYNLATRLHGSDYAVHVVSLKGPGELQQELAAAGVPATNLAMRGRGDVRVIPRLLTLLRQVRPDLLCTYLFHANHLGRLLAPLAGIRRILTVQESADAWRRWPHNLADQLTAPLVNQFVANSEAVKVRFCAFARVAADRVAVIHNGIDLAPYQAADSGARERLRAALGLDASAFVFVTIAHLNPYKGHPTLVEAAGAIAADYPQAHWLFAGSGRSDDDVRRQVEAAGLSGRIRFLGIRRDVPDLLAASDAFVLPSHWEGCPLSILEAMAAGRAVIASAVGGVGEIVAAGETGLLTPPKDPASLADAMRQLLDGGDQSDVMGRRGRERAFAEFGLETQVARTRALYERVLES